MSDCPVCYSILDEESTYKANCCYQELCKDCLTQWQKTSKSCIFCRYEDDKIEIIVNENSNIEPVNICHNKRYELICYFLITIGIILIIFRNRF